MSRTRRTPRRRGIRWGNLLIVLIAVIGAAGLAWWGAYGISSRPGNDQPAPAQSEPQPPPPAARQNPTSGQPAEPDEPEPEPIDHSADWRLILASPASPVGYEFTPPELEDVQGFWVDSRIAQPLREMIAAAASDGVELMVVSGYRPAYRQRELHYRQIERFMGYGQSRAEAVATASTIVLPPGTSEHQTGLAVDIVTPAHQMLNDYFADTPAGRWLAENSWRHGFNLRYPRDSMHITGVIFEPWHFRYVGREHAQAMFEGGYVFECYLRDVLGVAIP